MSFPEEEPPRPIEPAASEEEPIPAEPAPSEETPSEEVVFSEEPNLPEDFTPLDRTSRRARARRRRANRTLVMPDAEERAAILDGLARRSIPSFEFFVFAVLCGAVLGAAYLMDSPAVLLLGILLAPLLTPWVGMVLAVQTGSWRFFFLTLGGVLEASLLVFLTGALAGWVGRLWLHLPLTQASYHSHLWWPDLFLLALGAILLTISFVRSENRPVLPSIMLAYGLFMPLSAGGIGLGIGSATLWPDGAEVFLVHLALAGLVGVITLAVMRFKPLKAGGYFLPIFIWLLCLAGLVYFTGLPRVIRNEILAARPTIVRIPTAVVFVPYDSPTSTDTPTATATFTPSDTPSPTATASPTPAYAVIKASTGGGAYIRSVPAGGNALAVLLNGTLVQVMPEIQTAGGFSWAHVRWNNMDGWVMTTVLLATTETPPPTTLTLTPTP
ncbi:MAG: DUF389 domain-containing protein [Anaerolineales bacterium]|jgi:hypothetical protein